ncbi:MAG: RecX family transcriptional regulator [Candidatus Marinimicrobia bacterium]|nr:RecX family transcriptional regulator [Candidatus Neomarinimicrobiota bacterium]MCF7828079.1 RecX family transcriptional regulator [Candidatus Neomarinimicrobiota bacterium]MCF7879746.1 RecX family transcriptional regulator [Candidatus Neomarinimicrobiota bacterium]
MQVTKIAQQKKNKRRYSIFLDGEFGFGIHEAILLESGLHSGDKLTHYDIAKLEHQDAVYAAKEAAFNLLKYRQRSVGEMRSRLYKKDFDDAVVEEVVEHLLDKDYLNDEEFAETFAEDQLTRKNIGPIRLKAELSKKRIPDKIIEDTVASMYQKFNVVDLAREAAEKKMSSLRNVDYETAYRRLTSYLGRRGFPWDVINEVIDLEEWD